MSFGIKGRILDLFSLLYSNVECTVKVNDLLSACLPVSNGLKQLCKVSPTLLSVYLNVLAQETNRLGNNRTGSGVQLDGTIASVLIFADDIELIAANAETYI